MRFCLLDQITDLQPGKSITAIKHLRAEEDYLRDHFPRFAVMPGVLMVEALFQAACHLIRVSEDFAPTVIDLVEARNVKFADFVQPGETLEVLVEITKNTPPLVTLKAQGSKGGTVAVSAKLTLRTGQLFEEDPKLPLLAGSIRNYWRESYQKLLAK